MRFAGAAGLFLAGITFLSGCGGNQEAEVSGTVHLDGKPLKEGFITFEEKDKSKKEAQVKIEDGKYSLKMLPGSKVVRINASRPTSKPDPVMGSAAKEEMIAMEFNKESNLTVEIKPGKNEGIDFLQLKSRP